MSLRVSFFEDVSLVEIMYLVFTRMPGRVTVGDSGLCCCVLCLSSTFNSLCLLILQRRSKPHSVSDYCTCVYGGVYKCGVTAPSHPPLGEPQSFS